MMNKSQETNTLLVPMIKKTLCVGLCTARVSSAEMELHASEHLRYMKGLEAKGLLWGPGPFVVPGAVVGDGLTIFNVPDEADVHRLMAEEPLTKLGMRTYAVHRWELARARSPSSFFCRSRRSHSLECANARRSD